jgi:hypothetical protein
MSTDDIGKRRKDDEARREAYVLAIVQGYIAHHGMPATHATDDRAHWAANVFELADLLMSEQNRSTKKP